MRAWLGAALICAFGAAVAGAEGEARPPVELEAERLLRQLADPNLRDRAIDRLAALGPEERAKTPANLLTLADVIAFKLDKSDFIFNKQSIGFRRRETGGGR